MPSSLHARMMRNASSPRLAMRTLLSGRTLVWNPAIALDHQQWLAVLDCLLVVDEDLADGARELRLAVAHELHHLDDAEHRAPATLSPTRTKGESPDFGEA